ncbi:MAG: hypothetical protein PVH61_30085 [Candidatus Aminicenantes bacterium]|jgi:hypothetical protein
MMAENVYLILSACLCLLFLAAGVLSELKKKSRGWHPQPIHGQPDAVLSEASSQKSAQKTKFHKVLLKIIPFLMDLPRDTVIKGLAITGAILFTRKLVFYLPYTGIIQTKFSIWWMDRGTLIFLHIIFVFYMVWIAAMVGLTAIVRRKLKFKIVKEPNFPALVQILFFWGLLGILLLINKTSFSIPWAKVLILIVYAPLILFKMLCSGKYLGILTGFLLGYFIVARYKKLSPQVTKDNAKFLIAPAAIIIILMVSGYFIFTGNWQERFQGKIQSIKNPAAAADLLDAAYTIPGAKDKAIALEKVAAVITAMGDSQWRKEKLLQAIKLAGTIEDSKQRNQVLKEIAVFIATSGDTGWATTIANGITDQEIKNKAMKQIREKIEEQ